jgi:multicomponent Na+:H+ antiporter subunit F
LADLIFRISAVIALVSLVLTFIRFIKGPSIFDKVVALDIMTIISLPLIVFIAVIMNRIIYIDIALVYALISFTGVVAVARYLERGM